MFCQVDLLISETNCAENPSTDKINIKTLIKALNYSNSITKYTTYILQKTIHPNYKAICIPRAYLILESTLKIANFNLSDGLF